MKIHILRIKNGNIGSLQNMLKFLKHQPIIIENPKELVQAERIIIPGVGNVGQIMAGLNDDIELKKNLTEAVMEKGIKTLGICVGMQILFETSEESSIDCLGWIPGKFRKFDVSLRSPFIGWNTVHATSEHFLTENLHRSDFYFMHSYVLKDTDDKNIIYRSNYGGVEYVSGIAHKNMYGTQFHPELSSHNGMKILTNFIGKQ